MSYQVSGETFTTVDGKTFTVREVQLWAREEIMVTYRDFLSNQAPGQLLSVWIMAPVPLVTIGNGVVRLKEIELGGRIIKGSTAISTALDIAKREKRKKPAVLRKH